MKISYTWLKEFIQTDLSLNDISDTLTMLGIESEILLKTDELCDIIVGEIISIKKHPNADRLNLCEVNDGTSLLPVVCGANNVKEGIKIAFSPVGSMLPGNFKIKEAKIRGEISKGMICSERELCISDEHDGIMILNDSAVCGQSFNDYLSFNYDSLDLDITPNRPDCFSHIGIARDLCAKLRIPLILPNYTSKDITSDISSNISVEIENKNDCPRYIAGIIENVNVSISPNWLKKKIESVGLRSINNLVDISNYIMIEMGQPTHFFDYDKLKTKKILIRKGQEGEKITTLDDIDRSVGPDQLLITDGKIPIAIAGIMGGQDSAITKETKNILIESAFFNPTVIRKSAKSLNMSTDASKRFERGADINGSKAAFWRAISMIEDISGGQWIPAINDNYPLKLSIKDIELSSKLIKEISGITIPDNFINETLSAIGCKVSKHKNSWVCVPPSWRPDITRDIDLIEELIRLFGYNKIPSNNYFKTFMNYNDPDPQSFLNKINNALIGLGFSQAYNNSLQSKEEAEFYQKENLVIMKNPLSDKMTHLRSSLLHGLFKNIDHNINNGIEDIMIFEHGTVFTRSSSEPLGIAEKNHLCGLVHGKLTNKSIHIKEDESFNLFNLKGLVTNFFAKIGIRDIKFLENNISKSDFDYSLSINHIDKELGFMGKVSTSISREFDLNLKNTYAFQLNDLNQIISMATKTPKFKKINPFPIIERDLNFIIRNNIKVGEVIELIRKNGHDLIKNVVPISIYNHDSFGKDNKAISFNIIFQSPTKTLEDKLVNPIIDEIIKVVCKNFNAKLR